MNYGQKVKALVAQNALVKSQAKAERAGLRQAEEQQKTAEEAQGIIQAVAQTVQEKAHNRVAGVVSKCLESVFDSPYELKILFEKKRGKTEAKLVFVRDGIEVDPMSAAGGGVIDVAAFALRLSCLVLSRPPRRRVLVMDEPFKFISAEYRPKIREMMETLSKEMGIQFIMVTHDTALRAGKIIELE